MKNLGYNLTMINELDWGTIVKTSFEDMRNEEKVPITITFTKPQSIMIVLC